MDAWDSDSLYRVLHDLASRKLAQERAGHSLLATDLAHEAWIRLRPDKSVDPKERRLFRYQAARAMHRVLVDHARRRKAKKRGGDHERVTLHDDVALTGGNAIDVLAVSEAIDELRTQNATAAGIAEQLIFGDLDEHELAQQMQ